MYKAFELKKTKQIYIQKKIEMVTMSASVAAIALNVVKYGSLITIIRNVWELSQMIRQKLTDQRSEDVEELIQKLYQILYRMRRCGLISKRKYRYLCRELIVSRINTCKFYTKSLSAEIKRKLMQWQKFFVKACNNFSPTIQIDNRRESESHSTEVRHREYKSRKSNFN